MPAAPRLGRVVGLVALGLVLAVVFAAAGSWQWRRFEEKRVANSELRSAAERPPSPVDDVLAPGRGVDERLRFRTVTATGRYDVGGQVLVRQREVGGRTGFLVVTPLRTASDAVLLVCRGFVPASGAAIETPTVADPPPGEVRVTGRVYPSETGGLGEGLPAQQVARVDVQALAARLGAPTYGGFVELVSSDPPQAGLTPLPAPDLSNPAGGAFTAQHLAYVVQWFLFAAFAVAGPVLLIALDRRGRRGRRSRRGRRPRRDRDAPDREPARAP